MTWIIFALLIIVPLVIFAVLAKEDSAGGRPKGPIGRPIRVWKRGSERRRHPRHRATVPLTYTVLHLGNETTHTEIRDVSFGGLGIVLYEKLPPSTELELRLQCGPPKGTVVLRGMVRWVKEMPQQREDQKRIFWAGVQITHSGGVDLEQLQSMVMGLSGNGDPGGS